MTQVRSSSAAAEREGSRLGSDARWRAPNKTPLKGDSGNTPLPSFAPLQVTVALGSESLARSCRAARSQDKGDALHFSSLIKGLLCRKPFIYGLVIMNSAFLHLNALASRATQHAFLPVQPGREFRFITPGTCRPLLQRGMIRQP